METEEKTIHTAQTQHRIKRYAVEYRIKNMGFISTGTIGDLVAHIRFDGRDPARGSISATLSVATISSGNTSRDAHLKSKDYFDARQYPYITMQSVSFTPITANEFNGLFLLTIKDKSIPVKVPFRYQECNGSGSFKAMFRVNRKTFGVGGAGWLLAPVVLITIEVITELLASTPGA